MTWDVLKPDKTKDVNLLQLLNILLKSLTNSVLKLDISKDVKELQLENILSIIELE